MKPTAQEIKDATGIMNEKVEVLADELDRIQSIKVLFLSDGGKTLIDRLNANCQAALGALYATTDPNEAIKHLATYRANIDLLAELQDITAEAEIARQLDEAVKEAAALLP